MRSIFMLMLSFAFLLLTAQQAKANKFFFDITEAKAYAKKENKAILMVFAGSDWCRPCIQFKKEILEDASFQEYADQKLVILYLDFPARKKNKLSPTQTKHNEALAEKYNSSGAFPNIIMMDATEKILGELAFKNQGTSAFITSCKKLIK